MPSHTVNAVLPLHTCFFLVPCLPYTIYCYWTGVLEQLSDILDEMKSPCMHPLHIFIFLFLYSLSSNPATIATTAAPYLTEPGSWNSLPEIFRTLPSSTMRPGALRPTPPPCSSAPPPPPPPGTSTHPAHSVGVLLPASCSATSALLSEGLSDRAVGATAESGGAKPGNGTARIRIQ